MGARSVFIVSRQTPIHIGDFVQGLENYDEDATLAYIGITQGS